MNVINATDLVKRYKRTTAVDTPPRRSNSARGLFA